MIIALILLIALVVVFIYCVAIVSKLKKNTKTSPEPLIPTLKPRISGSMPNIGEGPCAKKMVTCSLETLAGNIFIGMHLDANGDTIEEDQKCD